MQIVRTGEELARALSRLKPQRRLALVPTMGALHDGHMALLDAARTNADAVMATVFVNPTQFNDPADLERYPRTEDADLARLDAAGCDLVWLPLAGDLYPEGFATTVSVAGVSQRWEGEARPGHFDGVATVVAKLLLATGPDVAVFGEKDFQQLAVVRRLVRDLGIAVDIVGVPTVREADGLALSSRNAFLSPEERGRAAALPNALEVARDALIAGLDPGAVLGRARKQLIDAGFARVDYFVLVDPDTLEPLEEIGGGGRLIAAAVIGTTRLIDNLAV